MGLSLDAGVLTDRQHHTIPALHDFARSNFGQAGVNLAFRDRWSGFVLIRFVSCIDEKIGALHGREVIEEFSNRRPEPLDDSLGGFCCDPRPSST